MHIGCANTAWVPSGRYFRRNSFYMAHKSTQLWLVQRHSPFYSQNRADCHLPIRGFRSTVSQSLPCFRFKAINVSLFLPFWLKKGESPYQATCRASTITKICYVNSQITSNAYVFGISNCRSNNNIILLLMKPVYSLFLKYYLKS
jgi:hypothetical protein